MCRLIMRLLEQIPNCNIKCLSPFYLKELAFYFMKMYQHLSFSRKCEDTHDTGADDHRGKGDPRKPKL